jgi:hypothetical protein
MGGGGNGKKAVSPTEAEDKLKLALPSAVIDRRYSEADASWNSLGFDRQRLLFLREFRYRRRHLLIHWL